MDYQAGYRKLMDEVTNGRLSRRAVLKRGVALGLSAPAIAALLAACGSSSSNTATSASSQSTSAATSSTGASTATSASGTSATPVATSASTASATEAASSGPRGGGGALRLLWWQAPTIINCHLSSGTKDFDAARLCLEPLIEADADGNLMPFLAA